MNAGRALVVCLDALGDLVLRQPLLSALLDAGLEVELVVRDVCAPLVPFLDPRLRVMRAAVEPYSLTADSGPSLEALKARIEASGPDLLVFPSFTRSFAEEWLLRTVSAPRVAAFANAPRLAVRRWLATLLPDHDLGAPVPVGIAATVGVDAHEAERSLALGSAILGRPLPDRDPLLTLPDEVRSAAAERLSALGLAPGRYAFGCPGGTANHALKGWPARAFAEQVAHLHRRHALPVLLSGLPAESERLEAVAAAAAEQGVTVPVHLGDADGLPALLGLIAHSRAYVGTDTGPMHFAAALGVPVVALFGGGHWPRFLPRARRSFVATQRLPCFRCDWDCWLQEPACITEVDPGVIRDGIDWILSDAPDERRVHEGAALDPRAERLLRSAHARRQARELRWGDAIERAQRDSAERLALLEDAGRRLEEVDRARHADAAELTGYIRTLERDNAERLRLIERLDAMVKEREARVDTLQKRVDAWNRTLEGRILRVLRRSPRD
jgi:ADP-heptose:LPS heptosyltransferase